MSENLWAVASVAALALCCALLVGWLIGQLNEDMNYLISDCVAEGDHLRCQINGNWIEVYE